MPGLDINAIFSFKIFPFILLYSAMGLINAFLNLLEG